MWMVMFLDGIMQTMKFGKVSSRLAIPSPSILLKIIAGVLTPDSGSVKVNGRIAPFLELGVGFNPELAAEDSH